MVFLGTYEYSVDERGRVAIPSRLRASFGSTVIVAKGPDRCLEVHSPNGFQERAQRLLAGLGERQRDRRLSRAVYGGAVEVEIDKQGRVLIPATLRGWASIEDQAVIVARGNFLEVWDAGRHQAEADALDGEYAQMLEMLEQR